MNKLLLLHGALGCANDLQALQLTLQNDLDCVVFEFPGHGKTPLNPYDFHIPGFAKALGAFVSQNKLEGCHVFGYSMGGFVATKLQTEKACFQSIYTLGTKFIWNSESATKESAQLNPAAIEERFPAYAQKLSNEHTVMGWKNMLEATARMMVRLSVEEVLKDEDWSQLKIPIAIGLGDRDKMVPLSDASHIMKKMPQACLDVLPYTPHPLDKVDVNLLRERLRAFHKTIEN